MKYMGSKRRYAKDILPIILKDRYPGQWYVEPFVGGFNSMCLVPGRKIANDRHPYLIAMYKALQKGWMPPTFVSEEEYNCIKANKELYPPELVGFVGFTCTFGSRWMEGYARDHKSNSTITNQNQGTGNIIWFNKHLRSIKETLFFNHDYKDVFIPPKSIVYCDAPYLNTKRYTHLKNFNHKDFYRCLINWKDKGHTVYFSEFTAPDLFKCVWSTKSKTFLDRQNKPLDKTEKLFKV